MSPVEIGIRGDGGDRVSAVSVVHAATTAERANDPAVTVDERDLAFVAASATLESVGGELGLRLTAGKPSVRAPAKGEERCAERTGDARVIVDPDVVAADLSERVGHSFVQSHRAGEHDGVLKFA